LSAALSGNPPSVFQHDGSTFSTSIAINAFSPIDDYIKAEALDGKKEYLPFAWDKVGWAGKIWGLSLETGSRRMFFNKKLLGDGGYTKPPASIPELDEYAAKLTKKVGNKFDQVGYIPWFGNWHSFTWAWLWGAKTWDPDTNKILLTAPEWVAAFEWEATYPKQYGIQDMQTFREGFQGAANNPFFLGKLAMMNHGSWMLNDIPRYAPQLDYDVAPVPPPPGKQPTSFAGGFVMGLPNGAKSRDESWKFIRFMTS